MKKILSVLLSVFLLMQCTAFFAYAVEGKTPVLSYSFEDTGDAPSMFGNAALVYDHDKKGKVLSLDGSNGTYAEIPQGFFDGRDVMTIQFDVLPNDQWGNFFTFCFGADNNQYSFFRMRNDGENKNFYNCLTTNSWQNEHGVDYNRANYNGWMNIALVYDNYTMKLYVDGVKVKENTDTTIKVSDLGSDLYSYFGKSLYDGDGFFHGCFDNFEVYDSALTDSEIAATAQANIPEAMAVLRYTFEDGTTLPTLYGNASTVSNSEHGSKVLSLDGTSETYAEIPQGLFDNKDEMTILFDIKPNTNSGNYFTFAFGQNNEKYDFFRVRGSEVRNAITTNTYYSEREVKTSFDATDSWMAIALVFDNGKCQLYVNGTLKATNNDAHRVSELGTDLLGYFGKSFYDGDGYFNGLFDNFEVYDKVLSPQMIQDTAKAHLPLLLSVNVGVVVSNLDGVSGTDNHTMVSTSINRANGEITSIIQRRQDPAAVPVNFISLNDDCSIYVDNEAFTNGSTLDLTSDRSVRIVHGSAEETYTLKAAQIANNPVLPGMYADPDIDVFDGKFWIYPTTDGVPGWGGTQFHAFSSEDMQTWTDEGVILDNKDKNPGLNDKGVQIASCTWSNGNAWAPAIEKKGDKYYFYFCGRILSEYESIYGEGMAIGVAWASSPAGPYTASDSPILYPKMVSDAGIGYEGQVIDPAVYTEGDTSYLLFGNGNAAIAELNSDMLTVKTSTMRKLEGLNGFRESVAVFKRNGVYYWHWSCDDTGSENYSVHYGTSTSLTGAITYRGVLVEKDTAKGILATGHQSVIYIPETDKAFIAYHRFYTPLSIGGNVGHHRETCVDEITFNRNVGGVDLLNQVTPSMAGVGRVDINGMPVNNYDARNLENIKLAWDFGLTPNITYPMNATTGDASMTLVYWGDNAYYYDGSNGLRTGDGFVYIENLASYLEDEKDIDIQFTMITNDRYNDAQAGAFAIGSANASGNESAFNDLIRLKNDGSMEYRGGGSTEDIRAGAKNAVTQGEHTYRIYFRYSTKTISVYQDGKLIGFKQDNNLSKSKFNFLALGVWRDTYYGKNTIEKLTISQPDIKDSGYIDRDTLVSGISKQDVSQDIGYASLEAVINEINSSDFQASYAEITANEDLYTSQSLANYYAALNRVKLFDASSAVYDYSNNTTVSGAADEIASIVSDFNAYKEPEYIGPSNGYNLTVTEQINVNFYVDMEYYGADDGYIEYSYLVTTSDKSALRTTQTLSAEDMEKVSGGFTDGDRKFTLCAAPAQIAEEYIINIFDKDGNLKTNEPIKTSIADYCESIINNSESYEEKYVNLAKSLLDYGQAANIYFEYAEFHNAVNAGDNYTVPVSDAYGAELSAAETAYLQSKITDVAYSVGKGASGKDIQITGVTYLALMNPEFRFYVDEENEVWAALTTVSIDDPDLDAEMVKTSNGNCVRVTGLKASEFGKYFTINIGTTSLTYNGYAYLNSVLTNSNDENLKALAKAVYRYAVASEAAFE